MPILSLRIVIGSLAAVSVAIIAAVTLGITLTTALSALRSVGKVHATSLNTNANLQTATLFGVATGALTSIQMVMASNRWDYPSDNISTFFAFDALTMGLTVPNLHSWSSCLTYFADNTRISYAKPSTLDDTMYATDPLIWTPYSTTFPNQSLAYSGQTIRYTANHTVAYVLPPGTPTRNSDGYWKAVLLPLTRDGSSALFAGVYSKSTAGTNATTSYTVMAIPHYRFGDARIAANVFAISFMAMEFTRISEFLANLGGTPNTVAVAYDGNGYLIGSSMTAQRPYITVYDTNTKAVPTGCSSTAATRASTGAVRLVCRANISSYPYDPLKSLAGSSNDLLLTNTSQVVWTAIGSENYFVASSRVPLAFPGMTVNIALFIPEADIIGDVLTGSNTAIGITCGLFVVVAVLNFVLVSLLLRPLDRIADRMIDAANLEDDGARDEPSAMAEVLALQEAYFTMNEELNRIRSFVPQSVLAAKRASADDDDEDDDEDARRKTSDGGASRASRTSRASRGTSRSDPAGTVARTAKSSDPGDKLLLELRTVNVTVLSGNLVGFHAALAGRGAREVAAGLAAVVQEVSEAVESQAGVFTFHGDRFLATFNAARACAGHARRAVEAGTRLVERSRTVGLGLAMRVGVATGSCVVGSVGSDRVKTFSTMGPAFTAATQLEATGRQHGVSGVLATQRTVVDVAVHFDYRYVDLMDLPAKEGDTKPMLVAEILARRDAGETSQNEPKEVEWLYVVGGERINMYTARNKVFEALGAGDVQAARKTYAEVLQSEAANAAADIRDALSKLMA